MKEKAQNAHMMVVVRNKLLYFSGERITAAASTDKNKIGI